MAEKQYPVTHSETDWAQDPDSPSNSAVMRRHGTEAPGSCALLHEHRAGSFACAGCGQKLFNSQLKFESGTGWPSFNDPIEGSTENTVDRSYGMVRTRGPLLPTAAATWVTSSTTGPPPTHLRYCINGVAMTFKPD